MSESRWRQNIFASLQRCSVRNCIGTRVNYTVTSHVAQLREEILVAVRGSSHAWVFQQTLQILKLLNTGKYVGVFWLAPSIIDLWQFIQIEYITGRFCPLSVFFILFLLPSLSPHFQLRWCLSLYLKMCLCSDCSPTMKCSEKNKIHVCKTNLKFLVSFSWEIKCSKHIHLWVSTCKVRPL